jgi:hypothetical protein
MFSSNPSSVAAKKYPVPVVQKAIEDTQLLLPIHRMQKGRYQLTYETKEGAK